MLFRLAFAYLGRSAGVKIFTYHQACQARLAIGVEWAISTRSVHCCAIVKGHLFLATVCIRAKIQLLRLLGVSIQLLIGLLRGSIRIVVEEGADRSSAHPSASAYLLVTVFKVVARIDNPCPEARLYVFKEIHRLIIQHIMACGVRCTIGHTNRAVRITVEAIKQFAKVFGRTHAARQRAMVNEGRVVSIISMCGGGIRIFAHIDILRTIIVEEHVYHVLVLRVGIAIGPFLHVKRVALTVNYLFGSFVCFGEILMRSSLPTVRGKAHDTHARLLTQAREMPSHRLVILSHTACIQHGFRLPCQRFILITVSLFWTCGLQQFNSLVIVGQYLVPGFLF